jgi:hypothetical protein
MKSPDKTLSSDFNLLSPNNLATAPVLENCQTPGIPPGDEGFLDWDEKIDVPPPRIAQTVTVQFIEGGSRR